jgi:hypothetical protein
MIRPKERLVKGARRWLSAEVPSVPEVVARLREIESSSPRSDGVGCFARLYREVTEGVETELGRDTFVDPAFLTALDVEFAGLFFAAFDATQPPPAWAPLFEQRSRRGIAPLQFALAGMNAHINRDLPVALVSTARALHLDLRDGSPEQKDFVRVNGLLAQVEARVKRSYLTGWVSVLDRLVHRVHRLDDVVAMWDIRRAREAAWANGLALWQLRDEPALSSRFLQALDRMVGLAGRGLLVPADSALRRLGRLL